MRLSRTITAHNRADLVRAVELAPLGAQLDLIDDPRTTAQNRLMWALLTDIADQVTHCGEKYEPEAWKACFMKALGLKLRFMPSLNGQSVVAVGYQSSRLDKEKFSELIESIYQFGAQNGVDFEARQCQATPGIAWRGGAWCGAA
jgi:hypothetical protein